MTTTGGCSMSAVAIQQRDAAQGAWRNHPEKRRDGLRALASEKPHPAGGSRTTDGRNHDMRKSKTFSSEPQRARARRWQFEVGRRKCAAVAALTVASFFAGCASTADDLVPDKDKVGVPIGLVTHYGSWIGVPDAYLDGEPITSVSGWGQSGSLCCLLLPREIPKERMMVRVRWITYRSNVEEKLEHDVTVPVNFAVAPGKGGSGLYVHLLPGHKAEVWYSGPMPGSTLYLGPAYPKGPAPVYEPVPGEKPQPTSDN